MLESGTLQGRVSWADMAIYILSCFLAIKRGRSEQFQCGKAGTHRHPETCHDRQRR